MFLQEVSNLYLSPFKAMGNAIFGSKEDTEDSNED